MDAESFKGVQNELNATLLDDHILAVSCVDGTDQLPDLVFEINGKYYSVPPSDYLQPQTATSDSVSPF